MAEDILMLAAYLCIFFALMLSGALVQIVVVTVTHCFPRSRFALWIEAKDYE